MKHHNSLMVAKRLVALLFLLNSAVCTAARVLTPPRINEQPTIRNIYEWGDRIAVVTEPYGPPERWAQKIGLVDDEVTRIVLFEELSCDAYYDVAHSEELGRILICGGGNRARVYQLRDGSWTAVSESLAGTSFRIAIDGGRIAVVSEGAVYLISTSSDRPLAVIPLEIKQPHPSADVPAALLLDHNTLFLAYDAGEFGGGLYRLDLKHPDAIPKRVIDDNVSALARTKTGVVWAAGGLSHLGGVRGSLYLIMGERVEVVASIAGFYESSRDSDIFKRSGAPFPGLTRIAGLALGNEDYPIVVLPEFGVFEFRGDSFVGLFEAPLHFTYRMPNYLVATGPMGLAVGQSDDIYVASRSLGIFVLRKKDGRYDLKQLLFEEPAHN